MNLPAAIEDNGAHQIPPSVAEKSNEIKRQGGINSLDKMISDLPESLTRNKEILDEVNCSFHWQESPVSTSSLGYSNARR